MQAVSCTIKADRELQQDAAAALSDAEAALTLTPTSVRARLKEAKALERLGRHDEAKIAYAAALKQAQQTGAAWYPAEIAQARNGIAR